MLKFVFLLTVYSHNFAPEVYVMDYGLTGEDCIERMQEYIGTHPDLERGAPSCEIDMSAELAG